MLLRNTQLDYFQQLQPKFVVVLISIPQACLDTFGTLMSLFKHEPDWVAVAHYNISLVMMQRRNYNECMQVRAASRAIGIGTLL